MSQRPVQRIPDGPSLHMIVRGDGYLVAGGSWSQMASTLTNHGPNTRPPAFCWPIDIAIVNDHKMVTLGKLWAPLFKVPKIHSCRFVLSNRLLACTFLRPFEPFCIMVPDRSKYEAFK